MKETNTTTPLIDFQLEDLWPILRKQRSVIFLFLGTVLLTTLVGSLLRTKEYRATTTIHLSPRPGQEVTVNEVVDFNTRGYFEVQQFYRTQIQIILSRSVREAVVEAYQDLGYDDLILEEDGPNKLYGMMTVVPEEQSQLVAISVIHTDPAKAAILSDLIAKVYSRKNLSARQDASSGATQWLQGQLEEYEDNVASLQDELHAFKSSTNLVDIEEKLTTLSAKHTALNVAFGDKTTERVLLETSLSSQRALLDRGAFDELAHVLDSPLLQTTSHDLAAAETHLADVSARYLPKHPEYRQAKARVDALESTLRTEVRRLVEGQEARLGVLTEEETSLQAEIAAVKEQMLDQQLKAARYDSLKSELERAEGFYDRLSQRLEEVSLSAQTQLNNVQILDRAQVPEAPYRPNIPMALAVASMVGGVGGVALALLREYVDDTITSQLDVSAHLKVPFLGLVPSLPEGLDSHEADLFTHYHPRSSVAEAVRGLRAMLEMNPNGPAPRRLLVTSSVAREGKTSTSLRLGISFAQMGRKVVLIDADLRRPRVHKVFSADNSVGLSSYLVGAAEVADLANPTEVPNLYTVYSGPSSDHPAELMASNRMEELLTALEERFDVVILDTPPSVALSDAVTLSRRVDGILLVVKENSVSRLVVKQTIDLMQQVEANILGVVLNNVDLDRSGSKYKYYYAYRDYHSNYAVDEMDHPTDDEDQAAK